MQQGQLDVQVKCRSSQCDHAAQPAVSTHLVLLKTTVTLPFNRVTCNHGSLPGITPEPCFCRLQPLDAMVAKAEWRLVGDRCRQLVQPTPLPILRLSISQIHDATEFQECALNFFSLSLCRPPHLQVRPTTNSVL